MSDQDKIKYNKLIAVFMGGVFDKIYEEAESSRSWSFKELSVNDSIYIYDEDLQFDKSWSWLMQVVEKICRLRVGDGVKTIDYPNLRTFGMLNEATGGIMVRFNGQAVFEAPSLKEATYLAVCDFVESYMKDKLNENAIS